MSGWGYGDIYPEYNPGAISNHTHPNDPASSESPYCLGCQENLSESNVTELSAKENLCVDCYPLHVDCCPDILKPFFDEIRSNLINMPPGNKDSILIRLRAIEDYMKENCFSSQ
ncbi:MAG TPA: hypothetical protein VJ327_11085 [Patescibacteria group bacterium]|nr:hypothetical protein [Patescibacteria group bacterium]